MSGILKKLVLRRTFIIDRGFQFEMLFRAACYSIGLLMVLGVGVFFPVIAGLESGKDEDAAVSVMLYMHEHFWPVAILCVFLAMFVSVQLTHRIAGPLHRIKQCLGFLGKGVFPGATTTRKRDYLKDEVAILNGVVESLAVATDEIKAAEREVSQELQSCLGLLSESGPSDLHEAIAQLQKKTETLHEKIHYFQRAEEREPDDEQEPGPSYSLYEHPMMS